jgi:hypothetical protein
LAEGLVASSVSTGKCRDILKYATSTAFEIHKRSPSTIIFSSHKMSYEMSATVMASLNILIINRRYIIRIIKKVELIKSSTNQLTPCRTFLLGKLITSQLLRKVLILFMEPELSLPCSQKPAKRCYIELHTCCSHRRIIFILYPF